MMEAMDRAGTSSGESLKTTRTVARLLKVSAADAVEESLGYHSKIVLIILDGSTLTARIAMTMVKLNIALQMGSQGQAGIQRLVLCQITLAGTVKQTRLRRVVFAVAVLVLYR